MSIGTSSVTAVSPSPARHGLYAFIAAFLGLLLSVGAFVRPSFHQFLWFAGRLFRRVAVSYRISRGFGASVTGPYLIAEALFNVLTWALLIYAAEYCFHRWRVRFSAGLAVLVLLAATPAQAQVSCKLLQPAELESALKEWAAGGKASKISGSADNSSGIAFDTCRSEIVRPGQGNLQITVVVVKNLPMSGGDAIRTRNAASAREGQWKVKGAET